MKINDQNEGQPNLESVTLLLPKQSEQTKLNTSKVID